LGEDAHNMKNRYKLFLSRVSI